MPLEDDFRAFGSEVRSSLTAIHADLRASAVTVATMSGDVRVLDTKLVALDKRLDELTTKDKPARWGVGVSGLIALLSVLQHVFFPGTFPTVMK